MPPSGVNTLITSAQLELAPNKLMGFCDHCEEWYKFTDDGTPEARLHDCGNKPSHRIGFQITTQRSFDATAKKLTKSQIKKMGGVGA